MEQALAQHRPREKCSPPWTGPATLCARTRIRAVYSLKRLGMGVDARRHGVGGTAQITGVRRGFCHTMQRGVPHTCSP